MAAIPERFRFSFGTYFEDHSGTVLFLDESEAFEERAIKRLHPERWDEGLPKWGSEYGLRCTHEKPTQIKEALSTQVGGEHYTKCAIQPFEYSMANKLDPLQHTIVKYVTRFRDKNGVEDLQKARDCIDKLIAWENTHGTT